MEAASGPSSRENEGGHKRFSMPGGSDRSMPVHSTECSFGLDVPRSKSLAFRLGRLRSVHRAFLSGGPRVSLATRAGKARIFTMVREASGNPG